MTLRSETLRALDDELTRGRVKFPRPRWTCAALVEEVGELHRAFLQKQGRERVRAEALQVATLAIRVYEEGDTSFDDIDAEASQP